MVTPKRVSRLLKALHLHFPDPQCALQHSSALELLVATILSAQCTDARVNLVTPTLFRKYPRAEDYSSSPAGELEEVIRSTGFFNNKAKSIRGAARLIDQEFAGAVPGTMKELLTLPGVARKTANVLLGTWFKQAEGVVVDTHVKRIAFRLGLTDERGPERVERDLMDLLPKREWIFFSHALVLHGRETCKARRADCPNCCLEKCCPKVLEKSGK